MSKRILSFSFLFFFSLPILSAESIAVETMAIKVATAWINGAIFSLVIIIPILMFIFGRIIKNVKDY